jgi:hypothetical protein
MSLRRRDPLNPHATHAALAPNRHRAP